MILNKYSALGDIRINVRKKIKRERIVKITLTGSVHSFLLFYC